MWQFPLKILEGEYVLAVCQFLQIIWFSKSRYSLRLSPSGRNVHTVIRNFIVWHNWNYQFLIYRAFFLVLVHVHFPVNVHILVRGHVRVSGCVPVHVTIHVPVHFPVCVAVCLSSNIQRYGGSQQWQRHGFQCENAVRWWHGPGAMMKGRKGTMWAEWAAGLAGLGRRWLILQGNVSTPTSARRLWNSMWSTASFGKFSTSPHSHCQDHPHTVIGRILDLAELNSQDFSIWRVCRQKSRQNLTPIWLPFVANGTG